MFELIFLGTSAAAPTTFRSLTAQMLIAYEHRFLIDCGEGTQRQILQSGLGFKRLDKILITHSHLDQMLGLGGLLSTLGRWEDLNQIEIWGGAATLERVNKLINEVVFIGQIPPVRIDTHPLEVGLFFKTKKFTVGAFAVKHQGPGNFGYVFQERDHRPFLAEKADALGVPFGPERSRLVAGEAITLEDGRIIPPEAVLGEAVRGAKYVHVGDCGDPYNLLEVAEGADCLVMEATYTQDEEDMARKFGHMTAADSARFAREAGVKTLILNHISRRSREFEVRNEAQAIFPNTYVARDFDHFIIAKGKLVEKLSPDSAIIPDEL